MFSRGFSLRFGFTLWSAVGLAVSTAAFSQSTFVTLTTDNDWFAHQDRHYTSGSHVAFVKPIDTLPESVRNFAPLAWSADRNVVLAVGQRLYTPGNLNPKPEEPLDRPFAGWIYLQGDIRTRTGAVVDTLSTSVGYIGPAAGGRQLQKLSHHLFHAREYQGWEHQLRSEPTLQIGFERAWPALLRSGAGSIAFDLSPYAGAVAGNVYTYGNSGLIARFGRNLPDDLPVAQVALGTPRDGYRGASAFGWYLWLGVDARAVARNVFLGGSTFRDSPSVERKVFQHDVQLGLAVAWPAVRAGFTLVQRSREFDGQQGADRFGRLSISFAY
jgi:hypothetical protein